MRVKWQAFRSIEIILIGVKNYADNFMFFIV